VKVVIHYYIHSYRCFDLRGDVVPLAASELAIRSGVAPVSVEQSATVCTLESRARLQWVISVACPGTRGLVGSAIGGASSEPLHFV
jgi:hypothetical protein